MANISQYADYVPPTLVLTEEMKEARMPLRGGKGSGFLIHRAYPPEVIQPEVAQQGKTGGKGGKKGNPAKNTAGPKSGTTGRGPNSAATQVPPPGDTNSTVGNWSANTAVTEVPSETEILPDDTDTKSESTDQVSTAVEPQLTQNARLSETPLEQKELHTNQVPITVSHTHVPPTDMSKDPSQLLASEGLIDAPPAKTVTFLDAPVTKAVEWWQDHNTGIWYSTTSMGDHTQGDYFDNATGMWWTPSGFARNDSGKSGKASLPSLNPEAMTFTPMPLHQGKGGKAGGKKALDTFINREAVLNPHAHPFQPCLQSRDPRKAKGGRTGNHSKGGKGKGKAGTSKGKESRQNKRKRCPSQGKP